MYEYPTRPPKPGIDQLYILKWDYRIPLGKLRGKTVKEIYDRGKTWWAYLGWLYYNCEFLSFSPEILTALNITPIPKPGIDRGLSKDYDLKIEAQYDEDEKRAKTIKIMANASHKKKIKREHLENQKKSTDAKANWRDEKISSAGRLAWYNQGHRK